MKSLLLLSLISSAVNATTLDHFFTTETAQNYCEKAQQREGNRAKTLLKKIESNANKVLFLYSSGGYSIITISDFNGEGTSEIRVKQTVNDIKVSGNDLVVVSDTNIILYDLETLKEVRTRRTLDEGQQYSKYNKAYEAYIHNDDLYIAHGEAGVIKYELSTLAKLTIINPKFKQPTTALRSLISGVTGNGTYLYLGVDNVNYDFGRDKRAFEGIGIYNLKMNKLEKAISVNQNQEAYHLPSLQIVGSDLWINNLHLYFQHDLKKLHKTKRYLNPDLRVYSYTPGYLVGRALLKGKAFYGCFFDRNHTKISAGISRLR